MNGPFRRGKAVGCGSSRSASQRNRFATLLACASLAVACAAADKPGPPVPLDGGGGEGRSGPNGSSDPIPTGSTDVTLPCQGFNYAELDEELLTYSVQIHSENTDLTETLATQQRLTSFAMRDVLIEYTCQELSTMDLTSVEMELMRALEQRYRETSDEAGEIDTLSLHIDSCK